LWWASNNRRPSDEKKAAQAAFFISEILCGKSPFVLPASSMWVMLETNINGSIRPLQSFRRAASNAWSSAKTDSQAVALNSCERQQSGTHSSGRTRPIPVVACFTQAVS
jgi:hypothetical protein